MRDLAVLFTGILLAFTIILPAHATTQSTNTYYDLGVFEFETGNYPEAEAYFLKALKTNPGHLSAGYYLGKTYLKTNRLEEAEKYLKTALTADPDLPGLRFDWAYLFFKRHHYREAAELFQEVIKEDPHHILAHYYAGISLMKAEKYREAIYHLEFSGNKSSTIKNNGYYYTGICYKKIGDIEKAAERFNYVVNHAQSVILKQNAQQWLKIVQQEKEKAPYSLYLKLGCRYDDNVTLEPTDDYLPSDEEDILMEALFSGNYHLVDAHNYKFGIGYSHYQSLHQDLSEYDMTGLIGNIYMKYHRFPLRYGLSYCPIYHRLDSDGYLVRHRIKTQVEYEAKAYLLFNAALGAFLNNHLMEDGRSGHTIEGEMGVLYGLPKGRGYILGDAGIEFNQADHSIYDYERFKFKLGVSIDMLENLTVEASGEVQEKDYQHFNPYYNKTRDDTRYIGYLSFSMPIIYEWLTISTEFEFINNNSNVEDFDYEEKTATLSLSVMF